VAAFAPVAALLLLVTACGSDGEGEGDETPGATAPAGEVTEEEAVEVYLGEMEKLGWFYRDEPVEVEAEYLLIAEAQAKTSDLGLSLYATLPGPGPYPDGLPGWFIVARGDFYEVDYPQTPRPETWRRPAVSTAFVDLMGGFTYGMKFTDVTPTATPKG
jgi:hypothetical protein